MAIAAVLSMTAGLAGVVAGPAGAAAKPAGGSGAALPRPPAPRPAPAPLGPGGDPRGQAWASQTPALAGVKPTRTAISAGVPASQVAHPYLPPGNAQGYSMGASVDPEATHAGAGSAGSVAKAGSGPAAAPAGPSPQVVTAAATVPGPPGPITVNLAKVTAALSWSAPSTNGGAAIDSYVIETYLYNPATNAYAFEAATESCGSCPTAEVVGLIFGKTYSFVVYAHNSAGYSSPSISPGETQSGLGAPGHPQMVAGNGDVEVSWSAAPVAPETVSYYEAALYEGQDFNTPVSYQDTNGYSATFGGLTNGASYTAWIWAIGSNFYTGIESNYATPGPVPPDTLSGAGERGFFSYDTYDVSDQAAAKVNIGSGDLYFSQRDLSLPGVAAPYDVGHDYNSLALAPGSSSQGGLLGPGWRYDTGYDIHLALGPGLITYYDRSGAAWQFTQAGSAWDAPPGLDVSLAYNATTNQWVIVDHQSNEALRFDSAGVLVADMDRNANPVTISYDDETQPTDRVTGSAGFTTANSTVIDPGVDNLTQVPGDGSANRTTTFNYSQTSGRLSSVTDAAGETTTYGYDPAGNLNQITSPGGTVTTFVYDSSHRVTEVDRSDGSGLNVTRYAYSPGQTVVTDPDGHQSTYSIDSSYRATATKDAAGATTATTWTGDSHVGSSTNQVGGVTTNTYGANPGANGYESLTQSQDPTGVTNKAAYSGGSCNPAASAYLPATTTDAVGGVSTACYDALGNPISGTDPAGDKTSVTYNADGTPATSTTANGQSSGVHTVYYETYSHQTYYAGPSNNVGPDQATVYDIWGNVAATENVASGHIDYYSYDAMGRLTALDSTPGNVTVDYTYGPDGELTKQVDSSGTTTRTYDNAGRLRALSAPNGVNDTYAYDPAGNLTTVTDVAGTTSYHYNALNEVDQVSEPSGRIDVLGYDAMGDRTDTWTNTGAPVAYNGTTVVAPSAFATHTHTTYDKAGQVSERKTTVASNDADTFSDLTYGYVTPSFCDGVPTGVTTNSIYIEHDAVRATDNDFCYWANGRLADAVVNGAFTSYTYDPDGNATSGSLGTHTYNSADENTDAGYAYDADANLSASPGLAATYNSAGQTTTVTPAGAGATSLYYSGAGQATRAVVAAPSGSTGFANGLLGVEETYRGAVGTAYIYLPDGSPIYESTPAGDYYYVTGAQGSVIGLVDPSGTPRASYTPYGAQSATALNGALPPNPYGYDGGYADASTGLVHFGARYYDPVTGRFTQPDPSGQSGGYAYAGDDPTNSQDPTGLFCVFGHNSSGGCNGGSVAGGASDFFTNSVPGAFGAAGHFFLNNPDFQRAGRDLGTCLQYGLPSSGEGFLVAGPAGAFVAGGAACDFSVALSDSG